MHETMHSHPATVASFLFMSELLPITIMFIEIRRLAVLSPLDNVWVQSKNRKKGSYGLQNFYCGQI